MSGVTGSGKLGMPNTTLNFLDQRQGAWHWSVEINFADGGSVGVVGKREGRVGFSVKYFPFAAAGTSIDELWVGFLLRRLGGAKVKKAFRDAVKRLRQPGGA